MTETNKEGNGLATEPIGRLLLRFSIPCVLSMLVSALYNIVDQIFIGQSVGYLGNAATNVVYPFTVVALALALLVGDGSAALLSLSLGSQDEATSRRCIGNGIVLNLIIGCGLMAVGFLFTDPILRVFGVTEASYGFAWDYMRIILVGIPFFVFTSGMNAAIRADGAPAYSHVRHRSGGDHQFNTGSCGDLRIGHGGKRRGHRHSDRAGRFLRDDSRLFPPPAQLYLS